MRILVFILPLIFLLQACKKEQMNDCFTATGIVKSETRMLEAFDTLHINRRLNVTLIEDTIDYVVVRGGENLIPQFITELKNGALTLKNDNRCNFMRSYKVPVEMEVHFTQLRRVISYGSSTISSPDTIHKEALTFEFWNSSTDLNLLLDNNQLEIIQHTGASDVVVKGRTEDLIVYMASLGSGDYDELACKHVYVQTLSSANCRVFADSTFYFKVNGNGNIFYKGNGEVLFLERTSGGNVAPIL
jgi:hypothetical protein